MANLNGHCPSPFLQETLFPTDGGFIDGRYCEKITLANSTYSCCLPCPLAEWRYDTGEGIAPMSTSTSPNLHVKYRPTFQNRRCKLDQRRHSSSVYISSNFIRRASSQMDAPTLSEYLLYNRHLFHGGELGMSTAYMDGDD